jgi:hypothetical protein
MPDDGRDSRPEGGVVNNTTASYSPGGPTMVRLPSTRRVFAALASTLLLAGAGGALAPSALALHATSGAATKPLKATTKGWYVFDGVPPTATTAKNGTYTRCTNDPDTPPVTQLGARYSIKNKSAPKKTKHILNGPDGIHFLHRTSSKTKPGAYYHRFRASAIGRSSLPPGKYTYRLKVKSKTLTKMTITLVDDTSC